MRKYAVDCEMVGSGSKSLLARVSIVDDDLNTVLDEYVKPTAKVTDYRTPCSGITPEHLKNAKDFYTVQQKVKDLLNGSILIGHTLYRDLEVLELEHPEEDQRDLAYFQPLRKFGRRQQRPALRILARELLGKHIQRGEHDSIEDAKATMEIYKQISLLWENSFH